MYNTKYIDGLLIWKYVDVCIDLKKNLYMILKNMYIWFQKYGSKYVCT
jgi:hypothetical protein